MIFTDAWQIRNGEGTVVFAASEAWCREWIDARPDAVGFVLERQTFCSCCGAINGSKRRQDVIVVVDRFSTGPIGRCSRHREMNPCAVAGCRRTRGIASGWYADEDWLCSEHWKIGCPPRSAYRRIYNRLFQLLKRRGVMKGEAWPHDLDRRYWRLWDRIVRRARGETAGDIDMDEINKLFGWTE